jgi:hypothetical protein
MCRSHLSTTATARSGTGITHRTRPTIFDPVHDPAGDIEALITLAGISGNEAAVRGAGALRTWLDGNQLLEECLGKRSGWRSGRRRALRDEMLAALAGKWFPGMSGSPLAKEILAAAKCARRAQRRPDDPPVRRASRARSTLRPRAGMVWAYRIAGAGAGDRGKCAARAVCGSVVRAGRAVTAEAIADPRRQNRR